MAALNINRLTTHIDELRLFIAQEKIDILAINETELDDLVGNNDIYIPGYEIVRRDRVTNGHNGGGVCFYIRSNLNYNIRQDLQHEKLEFLAVEINNPHSKPFLVSTWYRPQRTPWPVPEIFSIFEDLVGKIDAENIEFYLLGDANANLLPGSHDSISRSLLNVLDIYGLSQLITKPTRVTATSESLIDVCITNSPERIVNSDVIPLGISDHSLVFMTRKIHYVNRGSQLIICKRSFKNFNESSFLNDLNSKDWENVEQLSDPNGNEM